MFEISHRGSTVGREVIGGLTTFAAMSYILLLQPALLAKTGMDGGGVFMATCISAGAASILMGILANYPISLAPGMGENFFFVYTLCGVGAAAAFKLSWQEALAMTASAGVIFLLLSVVGFRSMIVNAIPDTLKSGIAAGIGLFIALIGLQWGNIIEPDPATFLKVSNLGGNYVAGLTLLGLGVTMALAAHRVPGAILWGILATTAATGAAGSIWHVPGLVWNGWSMPSGLGQTAGGLRDGFSTLGGKLFSSDWLHVVSLTFIVLFMVLFDTVGTLVGVAKRAGLIVDGRLPRAERALAADAVGTILGAGLGTSTVTCYIESITGVASGARTGLAAVVTGICLLAATWLGPLVMMIGGGVAVGKYPWGDPIMRYPTIAPALIFVGALMMRAVRDIDWDDMTEALPGFLAMIAMPFAYSIGAGIAIGFVSYAFGKLVTGRVRECPIIVYIFAILFALQYTMAV